jgi:hypothetical protein
MPRCVRLHKVPPTSGFCAVCGTRVLPDWVWLCLCALPFALIYAVVVSSRAGTPADVNPSPIVQTQVVVETIVVTATAPASTPRQALPIVAPSPTWTPAATLFPRVVLFSFHDLYVIAKGQGDGWVLKQETRLDDKCGWFKVIPQSDGKVALLTCYNRYVTSSRTGRERQDWVLRQETRLDECTKFTVHDLGNGVFAFETCAERYFTAGNGSWGDLSWLIIAQAKQVLDWERFTQQGP